MRKCLPACAALFVALIILWSYPAAAQQTPAPSTPQVVVVFHLRSTDLTVIDHKYRVFFNKYEKKTIPIDNYDLRSAIEDEFMSALAADKRMQWRLATADDKLDPAALAEEKTRTAAMLASAQGDRVLIVDVQGFGGLISGLASDRLEVGLVATLLDRASGRKIWKHKVYEKIPFSGDLQKLQAENQKEMKEGINALIEKSAAKLTEKVTQSKG